MRLKSFFANSVEEAIRQARHELGPDAMLVNSKRTAVEAQHLGAYEVVVCGDAPECGAEDPDRKRAGHGGRAGSSGISALPVDQLSRDVSELKQQMEKLALTLARSGSGMAGIAFDADLSRAFTTLTDAELDTELAYDVVSRIGSPVTPETLRAELAKLTSVDAQLGCPNASSRIVALVGPPGSGKTSALVKLAVQYGVTARRPVQVLTTDTYRIAAAEELRSYSAILGIGFQVLETPAALAQGLQECRHKDLVLIDTPGLSRHELEMSEDWAKVLATQPGMDTHLVLPASMRTADLKRVAEQYGIFRPHKLLFTRLDETETLGPILSLSMRMQKPISFLSSGQRIPEDIEPASVDALLDAILRQRASPESRSPESSRRIQVWRGGGMRAQSETKTPAAALKRYQAQNHASEERERLILEHLPQVRLIARRIHERLPESVNLDDLISTGTIGLIAAIDRFDPGHNVKLKTYAEYKIRGAILDSLRGLDWAPRQQRRRSKQIEAAIAALEQRLHRSPTEEEIAAQLDLSLEEYHEWLVDIRGVNLGSLEASAPDDDGRNLLKYISDDEENWPSRLLERSELQRLLADAIEKMPRTERIVISLYYHEELTLREIAKVVNLHESRVSQLKSQAILRLRSYLEMRWPLVRGA